MLQDALVGFTTPGAALSVVAGAGVGIRSNIYDILGLGVGVAPSSADWIGNRTAFGSDLGIGSPRLKTEVLVAVALATANAATMNIKFQASPEDATTHLPSGWVTLVETGEIAVTALDAIGDIAARFDFPPAFPANLNPRFLSILLQPAAGTNFSAGSVQIPVTETRDDNAVKFASRNFEAYRAT